ncbi:MAG: hypothetical protein DRN04_05835 [Thermoprotei archaeon]|nr:MAG: hypothetical protein DRN04_05835 [Thermoprotei archaeon]
MGIASNLSIAIEPIINKIIINPIKHIIGFVNHILPSIAKNNIDIINITIKKIIITDIISATGYFCRNSLLQAFFLFIIN